MLQRILLPRDGPLHIEGTIPRYISRASGSTAVLLRVFTHLINAIRISYNRLLCVHCEKKAALCNRIVISEVHYVIRSEPPLSVLLLREE